MAPPRQGAAFSKTSGRGADSAWPWPSALISLYDILVAGDETINGAPVTEERIAAWVAEAEAGYDVEALRQRGRGRPGRGAQPSQVVAVRLTIAELEAVDTRAAQEHKTRSQVVREALAAASDT